MTSPYAAATDATTANANIVFLLIDELLCFPLREVYQKPFPLTIAKFAVLLAQTHLRFSTFTRIACGA
jgi:hypothetical protein